jgi:hypothetical protein
VATPARIGLLQADNSVISIYCYYDGNTIFDILKDSYNTTEKVEDLLALGDISSLGSQLAPDPSKPHIPLNYQKDVTIAFCRDMGDPIGIRCQEPVSVFTSPKRNRKTINYLFDPKTQHWG